MLLQSQIVRLLIASEQHLLRCGRMMMQVYTYDVVLRKGSNSSYICGGYAGTTNIVHQSDTEMYIQRDTTQTEIVLGQQAGLFCGAAEGCMYASVSETDKAACIQRVTLFTRMLQLEIAMHSAASEHLVNTVHKLKLNLSMRQLTHERHKHNCYKEIETSAPKQRLALAEEPGSKCLQLHVPCFSQALDCGMLVCRANAR